MHNRLTAIHRTLRGKRRTKKAFAQFESIAASASRGADHLMEAHEANRNLIAAKEREITQLRLVNYELLGEVSKADRLATSITTFLA